MHRKQRGALIALGLAMLLALALVATACTARNRDADQSTTQSSDAQASSQARAYDPQDAFLGQELVAKAAWAVERMRDSGDYPLLDQALPQACGVLIVPNYCRVGYLYAVGGGMGVFLGRAQDGSWSGPAFVQLAHGGIGLQAGVERATLVYVFLDELLLEEALVSGFEFGAAAEITVIEDVARSEVSNRISDRPVYLFTMTDGLFVGVSLSGGVVDSKDGVNSAYYGREGISPEDIVLYRAVSAPDAGELQQLLTVELPQEDVSILR